MLSPWKARLSSLVIVSLCLVNLCPGQTAPTPAPADKPAEASPPPEQAPEAESEETTPSTPPQTLPDIVVTATRTQQPFKKTGSPLFKLTTQDYTRNQREGSFTEALRSAPGLGIANVGARGGLTQVRLRGTQDSDVTLRLDGVKINNPIFNSTDTTFLSYADLYNTESVEVLYGPQSTLFGSSAVGGVISSTTKKGSGDPKVLYRQEFGSLDTFRELIQSDGAVGDFAYSLHYAREDTQNNRANNDLSVDSYSLRLDYQVNESLAIGAITRGTLANYQEPGSVRADAFVQNDPNDEVFSENLTGSLFLDFTPNDLWHSKLVLGTNQIRYDSRQPLPNPTDAVTQLFGGRVASQNVSDAGTYSIDWQNDFHLWEQNTLSVGWVLEQLTGHDSTFAWQTAYQNAFYLQDQWEPVQNLFLTGGLRFERHEDAGESLTYSFSGAYLIEATDTKIRSSYGTGFKAPDFFRLYSNDPANFLVGNPNLKPEESRGWDVGLDQFFLEDQLVLSASYFQIETRRTFDFVSDPVTFISSPVNANQGVSKGMEFSARGQLTSHWRVSASYTHTDAELERNGITTRRRNVPRHLAGFDTNVNVLPQLILGAGLNLQADREELYPNFTQGESDDFVTARIYASYEIHPHSTLFFRCENLTDADYQSSIGFPVPGRSFYGGFELRY
ncbi:MAG: TonB-dependent receptor [Blastochloris sp.]|nr:TonB-dependent receptor [Blastochloris sp.]